MDFVRITCAIAAVLGLGCFFVADERWFDATLALLFVATLSALATYLWSQRKLYGSFQLTPNMVISLALFLWHLGFVGIYLLGLATDYRILEYFEISPHTNIQGVAIVTVGIAAFIFGLSSGETQVRYEVRSSNPSISLASAGVLGLGALLVVGYFAIKGRSLMGEYNSVFTEADSQRRLYNFGLMLAIVGLAPTILFGEGRRLSVMAISAAFVVAVVAALMGTRWVFLVMLALVFSALQLRGHRISLGWIVAIGVVCVFASIVVKERRAGNPISTKTIGDYFNGRYTHPLVEFFEETAIAQVMRTKSIRRHQLVCAGTLGASRVLPAGVQVT